MRRKQYRNGTPIILRANGCDGCQILSVNGQLCHEAGCPDAWRDYQIECRNCGTEFYPEDRDQSACSPCCAAALAGDYCDCEDCQRLVAELAGASFDDCEGGGNDDED
ncbi:MAG: hypothetical protein ACOY3P_20290 [Planctomycetota bacterium]